MFFDFQCQSWFSLSVVLLNQSSSIPDTLCPFVLKHEEHPKEQHRVAGDTNHTSCAPLLCSTWEDSLGEDIQLNLKQTIRIAAHVKLLTTFFLFTK